MALDGFSLRQVGLGQDNTSAQMAAHTEQAVRLPRVQNIETVQASKLTIKEEEEQEQKKKKKRKRNEIVDGFSEDDIQDEEQSKKEEPEKSIKKKLSKNKKTQSYEFAQDVSIRLNPEENTIELYSTINNKKLEAISSEAFTNLISKINLASGIMVNKQI